TRTYEERARSQVDVEGGGDRIAHRRAQRQCERISQPDDDLVADPYRELGLGDPFDRHARRRRRGPEIHERKNDRRHENERGERDEDGRDGGERERKGRDQDERQETRARQRERSETAQRGTSRRASTRLHTASASRPSISASAFKMSRCRSGGLASDFTSSGATTSRPSIAAPALAARSRCTAARALAPRTGALERRDSAAIRTT